MRSKSVTCPTCHELSGWLNVLALNMWRMFVTLETFHASMSSLKLGWFRTKVLMSVTVPTSQAEMGPNRSCADVALLIHSARASRKTVLVGKRCWRGYCSLQQTHE